MTGGTAVATAHGPSAEGARNQTPFWTAYHSLGDTMTIGDGELTT